MSAPLKADVTAADRLLKAAVRRAVAVLREPDVEGAPWKAHCAEDVTDLLANAATAAELLLSERAS